MAILQFQQPDKVIMVEGSSTKGQFEFRPLEPGYGITIGNALRRILLSSLEGYAITWVKIDGVDHEFSTLPGVIDDITQIILNLKKVRFKPRSSEVDVEEEIATVTVTGHETFTAGMLNLCLSNFEVVNTDLVICSMYPDVRFQMKFAVRKGRGYVPADENAPKDSEFGVIPVDSIHTPIRNVMYKVENFRVEQKTDYEKLILEILSDGTIAPKEALKEAATILIQHFMLFSDESIKFPEREVAQAPEVDQHEQEIRELLLTKLEDLDFSVRALNCLKAANVDTLGDLVKFQKSELLKFRNFGRKSLTEVEDVLNTMGLDFGLDISQYKLDKD